MISLLLNPIISDVSPEGLLPHESSMEPRAWSRMRKSALIPIARLRRVLNGWIAATIANHERQAAWLASRQREDRDLSNMHIYRGPIDGALERASRLKRGGVPNEP